MDMTGESMNSQPMNSQPMMTRTKSSARRMSMNSSQPMMRKSKSKARRVSNINTYQAGVEKGVNISQEVQAALPSNTGSSSNGLFGGSRKRKNKRKQKKTRKHRK